MRFVPDDFPSSQEENLGRLMPYPRLGFDVIGNATLLDHMYFKDAAFRVRVHESFDFAVSGRAHRTLSAVFENDSLGMAQELVEITSFQQAFHQKSIAELSGQGIPSASVSFFPLTI